MHEQAYITGIRIKFVCKLPLGDIFGKSLRLGSVPMKKKKNKTMKYWKFRRKHTLREVNNKSECKKQKKEMEQEAQKYAQQQYRLIANSIGCTSAHWCTLKAVVYKFTMA